jgi:hypothetical protein
MWKSLVEIIVSVAFVVLLVLKVDPFHWTMPDEMQMVVLGLVIAAFGLHAGLVMRQKASDEREALHMHKASRVAYIGGIALLVTGVTVQSLTHSLDPWLVGTLAGMVILKMLALIWSRYRN